MNPTSEWQTLATLPLVGRLAVRLRDVTCRDEYHASLVLHMKLCASRCSCGLFRMYGADMRTFLPSSRLLPWTSPPAPGPFLRRQFLLFTYFFTFNFIVTFCSAHKVHDVGVNLTVRIFSLRRISMKCYSWSTLILARWNFIFVRPILHESQIEHYWVSQKHRPMT